MFVAISRFTIANEMVDQVREAFRARPHQVDAVPGFVRMEVMSPVDCAAEVWLVTTWKDQGSFDAWHGSHAYHASHEGIPRGLKLVPGSATVRTFHVFAE